jgi:hypothetical protein
VRSWSGGHCDWYTRALPALVAVLAAEVVVEVPVALVALLEAAGAAPVVVRVDEAPPKLTLPTASWTLSGGGGMVSETLAPAEGLLVPLTLLTPAAEGPALRVVVVEVPDVLVLAAQAGLALLVAPALETPAGLADIDDAGATLVLAAGLVEADVTGLVAGVELDGAAAPPAQAASASEAAASVGRSAFKDMNSSAGPLQRA